MLAICGAWLLVVAALMPVYRDLASLIRNQPQLRNLLTPENYVFALGRALSQDTHRAALSRVPIGEDAHLGAAWKTRTRPVLFVLIVGETARADHFSLNGYARDTTPELARLGVVNFPHVTSCGTATEVSLPCMFSALGRGEYDGDRIRREEGLLNVLARTGLRVVWRDNQSGCKGVCDGKGIEFQSVRHVQLPGLCTSDGCLDEILLKDLDATVASDDRSQVIVMHQLGNHGPAYYSRYPERFRRFVPTCDTPELRHCSREEIVNAYDNALAYTDHVVAETIEFLEGPVRPLRHRAAVCVRSRRVAGRARTVPSRHALRDRTKGADTCSDGGMVVAGVRAQRWNRRRLPARDRRESREP